MGFTAIALVCDEVATWRDDTGANPAREVLAKLAPTMATVPSAFQVLASAPDHVNTLHHERYLLGNNEQQIASNAPTWIANPTITREQTQDLEPNARIWAREYLAQAQEHEAEPVLDREAVVRALSEHVDRGRAVGQRVVCLDPSSGTGGDAFTWIAAGWNERQDGTRVLSVDEATGQRGPFHTQIRPDEIVRKRVRNMAVAHGADMVFSDQHLAPLVEAECRLHSLHFQSFPFTNESKADAVRKLALMLEQDQLVLPAGNGWLRKELLSFTEKVTRTGKRKFEAKGRKHDDMVSALLILMIADSRGLVEGGVSNRVRRRDPKPFAGSKLESWDQTQGAPRGIDSLQVDNATGRVMWGGSTSPLSGGGF